MEDQPPEVSHYGSAITALDQLEDLREGVHLQKLRVLHCPQLTSMAGIEHLSRLTDLNLSSNALQRIEGLHNLGSLRVLNLSCNQIRVINGLAGLSSLEKLVLSFNKISSLKNLSQLYEFGVLSVLDIRANSISQLTELTYLAGLTGLKDAAFKGKSGGNPVCRQPQYCFAVMQAVPGLQFLDQQPVSELDVSENSPPLPVVGRSPPRVQATVKPGSVETEYKTEILRLQHENERLFRDLKDLMHKYEANDKYWSERYQRVEAEATELEGNLRAATQEKRFVEKELVGAKDTLDNCKEELRRLRDSREIRDRSKDELQGHMASTMRELGDAQRAAQAAMDEGQRLRDKLAVFDRSNAELKAQLKQAEGALNQLHVKALENAEQALQRFEDLQHKYEGLSGRLVEREAEVNELKMKNQEILELNGKFDENWASKYKEAVLSKDLVIESLKRDLKIAVEDERRLCEDKLRADKESHSAALKQAEAELKAGLAEEHEKTKEVAVVCEDLRRQNVDLKEILKMSVEKETRGRSYIADLTEIVTQLQQELDHSKAEHSAEVSHWEAKSRQQLQEIDALQLKYERMTAKSETVSKEADEIDGMLSDKTREISRLKREINDLRAAVEDDEETVKQLKGRVARDEILHVQEVSGLTEELREIQLSMGTKNALLEDQAEAIKDLKAALKASERNLEDLSNAKSMYKQNYEDKLQSAYDEAENYRAKLEKQEAAIQEIEEQITELTKERQQDKGTIDDLQRQLAEKNEALEYIEGEIQSLQDAHSSKSRREIQDRDQMISDLKGFRDELNSSLIAKDRECKELQRAARELEDQCQRRAWELKKASEENEEMKDELRVVLQEMENQKQKAAQQLQALTKLFA
jgi:chromosome segregation ATPase